MTATTAADVTANMKSNVKSLENQLKEQVDKKRHIVDGKVTQAKGLAQEKFGQLTNNDQMRRAGRRTQLRGKLQERGITLPGAKTLLAVGTAVAVIVAYVFFRGNSES